MQLKLRSSSFSLFSACNILSLVDGGGWLDGWVNGWLDSVEIRRTQSSQVEASLRFWLG